MPTDPQPPRFRSHSNPQLKDFKSAGALTISLNLAHFDQDGTTSRAGTLTAIFNPDNCATECFFQLAQLLESEFAMPRDGIGNSLRKAADALGDSTKGRE